VRFSSWYALELQERLVKAGNVMSAGPEDFCRSVLPIHGGIFCDEALETT